MPASTRRSCRYSSRSAPGFRMWLSPRSRLRKVSHRDWPRLYLSHFITSTEQEALPFGRNKMALVRILFAGVLIFALSNAASAADKIKFGMLRVAQPIFVGIDRGFFTEQGIEIEIVYFKSGAE